MSSPKIEVLFFFSASTGAPLTGLTPSFSTYKNSDGTNLAQPTITEMGGGEYKFTPVFSDPNKSIAYIADGGVTAAGRYVYKILRPEDWNTDDIAGAVWNATMASYLTAGSTGSKLNTAGGSGGVQFYANGDTVNPTIIQVSSPKHTQVKVTFSEPVVMTTGANGALNLSNYNIPGLTISAVVSLTTQQVMLTTSPQTANFLYSLIVTNVEDLTGNPIL